MSIEIGTKWVKDGEVVEVHNIVETVGRDELIWFTCKKGKRHILIDYDFLEQYKPYEEYVYSWAYVIHNSIGFSDEKMTREEFEKKYLGGNIELYACISETKEKRERK